MNPTEQAPFRDRELVEMLIDQPELLAFADALVVTTSAASNAAYVPHRLPARGRRWPRLARIAGALAVVAVAVTLLVSPWKGNPSFAERALAAIGSQPVLHVVIAESASGRPLFSIKTGEAIPRTLRTEVWYDQDRASKKTVSMVDGKVLDEVLETRDGGWTQTGPVYTCAWIAAHPVEATEARVSCNTNGDNGTTPHKTPERAPMLDPALAGFVDHYQSALASGQAEETGTGKLEGHDIVWLTFDANGMTQRVALDAHSFEPLLIEGANGAVRVLVAETLPYSAALFTKPQRIKVQSGGAVFAQTNVTPTYAANSLGGLAVWLGQEWKGFRLVATTHQERTVGYGPSQEPSRTDVIVFRYASLADDGTVDEHSRIDIFEATSCVVSVGWTCTARDPSAVGTVGLFGPISLLRREGLYVSIWNLANLEESPEVARALKPLRTG
jgi:hypothetical protein